jgi:hypothetical protein
MAIEKTVILNVETKEAAKNIDILSQSFEDAYGEIQPLTGRMGELEDQLYELANAGKQGTEEFKILANEVGRMKKTIQQTDAQVDGLAMTTSQKLGGALGGVTSGFELVQGAMGAMGVESEGVEKALLKVQSAMAIAQGVQGIRESLPAFKAMAVAIGQTAIGQKLLNVAQIAGAATMKALNFIMKQNPILLIVSAVAALVAAFALLGNAEEDEAAKQERLIARRKKAEDQLRSEIDLIKQKQKVSKGNVSQLENELKIMQSKGATDEQIYKKEKEINQKRIAELAYIKGYRGKLSNEEALEYNSLLTQKQVLTNEYNAKIKEANRKASEDAIAKQKERNEKQLAKQKEADEYALKNKALSQDEIFALETEQLATIENEKTKIKDEAEKERQQNEADNLEATSALRIQIMNKEIEDEKIAAAKKLEIEKELNEARYKAVGDTLQTISNISELFAGKSKESQRKAFNIQKAVNIATATIDTYRSAQAAYASGAAINPIFGAVAAAAAVTAGLLNVKKIASTQFDAGGASVGGATGGGSAPQMPTVQAANFNVVGAGGANQLAQLSSNPIKAYVVSGEVSTAQSLDRNIVKNATI